MRQTGKDLRKDYNDATDKLKTVKSRINNRLVELCRNNPDIIVGLTPDLDNTPIKAKTIGDIRHIETISIEAVLKYIDTIEKELANKEKYIQGDLFFR